MGTAAPQTANVLTHRLWTGHNLERIGDHATTICERVIERVTGKLEAANASRYETMCCGGRLLSL